MDGKIAGTVNLGLSTSSKKPIEVKDDFKSRRAEEDDLRYVPEPFQKVAQGMEEQFADFMLNEMNKTVDQSASGEGQSDEAGMEFYKSLQKTEQAKIMAAKNTLGLQKIILDQIYPKNMRNQMAFDQYTAQMDRKMHHNLPSYNKDSKADTIKRAEEKIPPQ